ncbi:MAG: ArsA-related P-loop ATPase [Deltaproteobacteria bacterium]|nr:ArsA-related P-loop ATPase [Deltaproteobacteria bacterium]
MRRLVQSRRVIVCVGSGGVGKTTTAAALGVAAASMGRRTLVITIDPARRLANALGLDALSHKPQRVDAHLMDKVELSSDEQGSDVDAAPLWAMMLDLKEGWDDMLARTAPSPAVASKILENSFYRVLSTELPGAHEFIACEHLQHLASSGNYDLVVLDTPPTQNALDFLDAPARILGVLDNEAFRFFADKSQSLGLRFLDGATGRAQSIIARFTGGEMLEELGDFLVLLKDLYGPLTQRTKDFVALLSGKDTAFVVVTAPQPAVLAEASFFVEELRRRHLPLAATIVNRLTTTPSAALAELEQDDWDDAVVDAVGEAEGRPLVAALDLAVRQEAKLAELERKALAGLGQTLDDIPVVRLPRLSEAVHDAARLVELLPWLVGTSRAAL